MPSELKPGWLKRGLNRAKRDAARIGQVYGINMQDIADKEFPMDIPQELELYAVRNKAGQWFRAKGFGGGGASWVDDISRAKIYPKIGQARARISFFANNYASHGVPDLVRLVVTKYEVIDEAGRVQKVKDSKERAAAKRHVARKQREFDNAQRDLRRAEEDVRRKLSKR